MSPSPTAPPLPERAPSKAAKARHHLNLQQTGLLGSREVYALRRQHIELTATLATRLSLFMRSEIAVEFEDLWCTTLKQWVEDMQCPTHLTLFKVEPLSGIFMLEVPPVLALTMVDRLMGGPGQVEPPVTRLSEIETALLDEVVQIMLGEWTQLWSELQTLRPVLLGHEMDARSLMHAPHDSSLLAVTFTARVGRCQDHFRFGIPYATMGALILNLSEKIATQGHQHSSALPQWNPFYDDVPVDLRLLLNGLSLSARALSELQPGDLLPLPPAWFQQVEVHLAQQPKFLGHLGTRDNKWAVELTKPLENNP